MKQFSFLVLLIGLASHTAFAKTSYGTCYGEPGCDGVKSSKLVTLNGCKQMLVRENYEQGSWQPKGIASCSEISVTVSDSPFGGGVPLPEPDVPTYSKGQRGVTIPSAFGGDYCKKHPENTSVCGGPSYRVTCSDGQPQTLCSDGRYWCGVCPN